MSKEENTLLLGWAHEIQEELQGTFVDKAIQRALDANDLDEVKHLVAKYSGEASQHYFYGQGLVGQNDVF